MIWRIYRALFFVLLVSPLAWTQQGGELRFCLRHDPKTFDPLLVDDDAGETIRYLTGGVLMRVNRKTQQYQPELAESWKIQEGGRRIVFQLRKGIFFSDGTPFSAEDVAYTIRRLMDPALHSPVGDAFRSADGKPETAVRDPYSIVITFPAPVAALERLFDQVAILSSRSPQKERASLGPFTFAEHKPGQYVLLRRNPNYWKKDSSGRQLPYLSSIRLDIQSNRELELMRFRRGELHWIESLDAETFDRLRSETASSVHDSGASFDVEMIWFNQVRRAPLPEHKKAWFGSHNFRRAISAAIQRSDLARIVYRGHASPAAGPFPTTNHAWFNTKIKPHAHDLGEARRRLAEDGFRYSGSDLYDRQGNRVEFSVITNAGNKSRARIAALLEQDLAKIGIRLNIVPLDFPSLIERITKTFQYEACLLGLVNVDPDPSAQMNVWLSSAAQHQWNPKQASPETPWEKEIDRLMRVQASSADYKKRKEAFDRVQEIVSEEAPFLYLVNRNSLSVVAKNVRNVAPAALRPQLYWNIESLSLN